MPSRDSLSREGISADRIHLVGNVMIDTLIRMLPRALREIPRDVPENFALVTLHRPSNVDDSDWLSKMIDLLSSLSKRLPVIFPIHPRTRERMRSAGINANNSTLNLMDPVPYLTFLGLQQKATLVIT